MRRAGAEFDMISVFLETSEVKKESKTKGMKVKGDQITTRQMSIKGRQGLFSILTLLFQERWVAQSQGAQEETHRGGLNTDLVDLVRHFVRQISFTQRRMEKNR